MITITVIADLGNFGSKISFQHEGKTHAMQFSSAVKEHYERLMGDLGTKDHDIHIIDSEFGKYYVGESVSLMYNDGEAYFGGVRKAHNEVNIRLLYALHSALERVNIRSCIINPVFSTPYKSLKKDRDFFMKFENKKIKYIFDGETYCLNFGNVKVIPEGLGSVGLIDDFTGLVRIVDVGSATTNILTFRDGLALEDECLTLNFGDLKFKKKHSELVRNIIKSAKFFDYDDTIYTTGGVADSIAMEFDSLGYENTSHIKEKNLANAVGALCLV